MEEVCIVGGGPAGILSAKLSLSYNLKPVVLEKSSTFGGLWKADDKNVGVWNSVQTNGNKYEMSFSDHLWNEGTPIFPSAKSYTEYVSSYVEKFDLLKYFLFNATVNLVEKEGDAYKVTYKIGNETISKVFKYVLLATGLLGKPKDPIKHREKFVGPVIHSAYYREPSVFKDKSVVVIGKSYSASDITAEAVKVAKSVTQVYNHQSALISRMINGLPFDFYFFNFVPEPEPAPIECTLARNAIMVRATMALVGNPGDICETFRLTDQEIDNEFVNIPIVEEDYYDAVKAGKVEFVRGKVQEYCENGIILEGGQFIPAEVVVPATGYYTNLEYLSDEIKEILKYDPLDSKLPVLLYKSLFHPSLPGLSFVAKIYSLIIADMEITAEIGLRWVRGMINLTQEELWEGVRLEERLRTQLKDSLWVYDSYSAQRDLLKLLGIEFDYEWLNRIGYSKGPLSAVLFFRDRDGQDERIAEFIRQIKTEFPQYEYN
jgi:dimethylaniline monooxygenase (N-oxide forming)